LKKRKKNLLLWEVATKACFALGVRANVQSKSSIPIGAKVEISSQRLYTRSQGLN
jgi:hypothetical protein